MVVAYLIHFAALPPNGLAQRQRRDWRDPLSIMHHFWQNAPARERRSRCPTGAGVSPLTPLEVLSYAASLIRYIVVANGHDTILNFVLSEDFSLSELLYPILDATVEDQK